MGRIGLVLLAGWRRAGAHACGARAELARYGLGLAGLGYAGLWAGWRQAGLRALARANAELGGGWEGLGCAGRGGAKCLAAG